MDQLIINNGSSAVFTCGAQAFPAHNIFWTFISFNGTEEAVINTVMAGSSSKYLIVDERINSRFGELTVMNVEFGDRGVYTCSAANDVGIVMASANLTVHGKCFKSTLCVCAIDETCSLSTLTVVNVSRNSRGAQYKSLKLLTLKTRNIHLNRPLKVLHSHHILTDMRYLHWQPTKTL